ncbi:MAG: nuclear transport factor 2 family protein [Acidobacteriota bacterium]|nr:nuclear transport factor 2 family protein [Acidobacteriota bacterium]
MMDRLIRTIAAILLLALGHPMAAQQPPDAVARYTIATFEQGLRERKLALIEKVVANDIVVLENGGRNDGWTDFRDHHLVPEMREPALPSKTELIKTTVKGDMAWAYSKTTMQTVRRGAKTEIVVWSAYVLERRNGGWKIVLLDWSVGSHPLAQ